MADTDAPLLIKRYASRRLYNTETSDYVTLEDIAAFIRQGRDVQIVDLKSGDDLTRQYLLQIIAEQEGRGESVLPINPNNAGAEAPLAPELVVIITTTTATTTTAKIFKKVTITRSKTFLLTPHATALQKPI